MYNCLPFWTVNGTLGLFQGDEGDCDVLEEMWDKGSTIPRSPILSEERFSSVSVGGNTYRRRMPQSMSLDKLPQERFDTD